MFGKHRPSDPKAAEITETFGDPGTSALRTLDLGSGIQALDRRRCTPRSSLFVSLSRQYSKKGQHPLAL
jgi:hypothetical protein